MGDKLPAAVRGIGPTDSQGLGLGAVSAWQYLGAFLGGALGGRAAGSFGHPAVFAGGAAIAALWLVVALGMRNPPMITTRMLNIGDVPEAESAALAARLREVTGVVEAVVHAEDGIAYLKVEAKSLDHAALRAFAIDPA